MFGAAAMSLSSFCVVTNALRLNLFKIHDAGKDKKIKQATSIEVKNDYNIKEKEQKTMVKVTVNVEGMMCGHCEAHVNEAIKKAFGAEDVVSSHESNTTVFTAPERLREHKIPPPPKKRKAIQESREEILENTNQHIPSWTTVDNSYGTVCCTSTNNLNSSAGQTHYTPGAFQNRTPH